jgi:hypothetical protein
LVFFVLNLAGWTAYAITQYLGSLLLDPPLDSTSSSRRQLARASSLLWHFARLIGGCGSTHLPRKWPVR